MGSSWILVFILPTASRLIHRSPAELAHGPIESVLPQRCKLE